MWPYELTHLKIGTTISHLFFQQHEKSKWFIVSENTGCDVISQMSCLHVQWLRNLTIKYSTINGICSMCKWVCVLMHMCMKTMASPPPMQEGCMMLCALWSLTAMLPVCFSSQRSCHCTCFWSWCHIVISWTQVMHFLSCFTVLFTSMWFRYKHIWSKMFYRFIQKMQSDSGND